MATRTQKSAGLDSSLKNLSISPSKNTKTKAVKAPVADSWEEAASSSDSDDTTTPSRPSTPLDNEIPGPPPPTPSSPTHSRKKSTDWASFPASYNYAAASPAASTRSAKFDKEDKRPEKSSAAAGRMIAGALGVKAPKKTEEGRAYEKAVREKERKRRERAREEEGRAEREREEARRTVWDG